MRNFSFVSKSETTFYVDFSQEHLKSQENPDVFVEGVRQACRSRLARACGGSITTSSEELVLAEMECFLHRCLSKSREYGALSEVFVYVNCNTGASLVLVPLHSHDYEGLASSIREVPLFY